MLLEEAAKQSGLAGQAIGQAIAGRITTKRTFLWLELDDKEHNAS